MAIQDSFNLSKATTSQAYAYKCWYNYNYCGNTMKISSKDMGEITQTWNGELKNWRATASNDENAYEIEDDDYSTAKLNGKESAKDKTGYDGGKGGMIARGAVDLASGVAGTLAATIGNKVANKIAGKVVKVVAGKAAGEASKKLVGEAAKNIAEKTVSKSATEAAKKAATEAATKAGEKAAEAGVAGFVGKAAEKAAAKAAEKAAEKGAEKGAEAGAKAAEKVTKAGKKIGWIITAPLALATGTAYMAKKPNKDEKEACDELQNTMQDAQASLAAAQDDMSSAGDEIVDLSDEAQAYNEDANDEIEDKKTEYDMYKASYDALMEKVNNGEALTEDEKALMKELVPMMQQLGVDIGDLSDETTDNVSEIYDEMGTYQDTYDNAASTMGEVEGATDYAESFDEATRIMCYVEAGSQTLNTASGGKAALQAGKFAASGGIFTAWAWAFAAAGAAGAAMSGVGAAQQYQWAGDVGTEIHMRRDTQDLNATTTDMYDENIDAYAGQMEGVEDLELEIPEDMSDPEGMSEQLGEESSAVLGQNTTPDGTTGAVVTGGTNTSATTTTSTNTPDDKDKDKNKA